MILFFSIIEQPYNLLYSMCPKEINVIIPRMKLLTYYLLELKVYSYLSNFPQISSSSFLQQIQPGEAHASNSLHANKHVNITVLDHHASYLQTLLWSQMGLCSSL